MIEQTFIPLYYRLNQITFQDIVTDIFNLLAKTLTFQIWGRNGQAQNGIDIYSTQNQTVIQCKYKTPTPANLPQIRKQIQGEMQKELGQVVQSKTPCRKFIFASTFPHDAQLQAFATQLQRQYRNIEVQYWGWEELEKIVLSSPTIQQKYFSNISGSVECVGLGIDTNSSAWQANPSNPKAYKFVPETRKNIYPFFRAIFLNNSDNTVVLNEIHVRTWEPQEGLSGLEAKKRRKGILLPIQHYRVGYYSNNTTIHNVAAEAVYLEPSPRPIMIEIEAVSTAADSKPILPDFAHSIEFQFIFNQTIQVTSPIILLNQESQERYLITLE